MRVSASSARSRTTLLITDDTTYYVKYLVSVVLIIHDRSRREMSMIESVNVSTCTINVAWRCGWELILGGQT